MSLSYTLRESLSGFTRTRLSAFVSIVTICISLLFLGLFAVASVHASRFIDLLRSKVELEAFLEEPLSAEELSAVRKRTGVIEGIEAVTYISKDEAARIFRQEFGENIFDILEFNPLPASLKISLKDGYKTSDQAAAVTRLLEQIPGIESVKYRKELLELIDTRAQSVNNLTLGIGVLISLSAIFLVSNTIRLAIYAKRGIIRTMELVGATKAFIRVPFLLEGMIQGLIGGILAAVLLYGLLEYAIRFIAIDLPDPVHRLPFFHAGVVGAGLLLGCIGGMISVIRFIRAGVRNRESGSVR
jgi:cell division transport system permease protein